MLINIGLFGVRRKRGGVFDFRGENVLRAVWDCTAKSFLIGSESKITLLKHGQLIKTKKGEKGKKGVYIYIFNILFFFFFFSRFFLSLSGAVECRRRPQPPVFPRVFYFQSIKIHITLVLTNIYNIICSRFKSWTKKCQCFPHGSNFIFNSRKTRCLCGIPGGVTISGMLINISRFFIDNTNLKLYWQHYLLFQLIQYSSRANVIFRHAFSSPFPPAVLRHVQYL